MNVLVCAMNVARRIGRALMVASAMLRDLRRASLTSLSIPLHISTSFPEATKAIWPVSRRSPLKHLIQFGYC
jgi:hypothetical protein